jgi:hypothetical protein
MLGVTLLNLITGESKLFKHATPTDPVYGSIFYSVNPETALGKEDSMCSKLHRILNKVCKFHSEDQVPEEIIGLICDMLHPEPSHRPTI